MKKMVVNEIMKRKTSPTGTSLAFVPGQNFVYELNDTATDILNILAEPLSVNQLVERLVAAYEVESQDEFQADITAIVERFLEHNILVEVA